MSTTKRTISVILIASTFFGAAGPAFAQQPRIECYRNRCHQMHSHGGTAEDWAGLGAGALAFCAMLGCFGGMGGSSSSGVDPNRTLQTAPVGPQSGNPFDRVRPLPGYGVGE